MNRFRKKLNKVIILSSDWHIYNILGIIKTFHKYPRKSFLPNHQCLPSGTISEKTSEKFRKEIKSNNFDLNMTHLHHFGHNMNFP